MADTFRFPNGGYEVVVCRKQDILDCIDENITDKEVLIDIIKQCEKDAAKFLNQGRWTGIPYIGNIRIPKYKQVINSSENKELINEAKEVLDHDQYVMFRKNLSISASQSIKKKRYYDYILSICLNRNKYTFRRIAARKGERFTKVFLFACYHITAFDRDITIYEDE